MTSNFDLFRFVRCIKLYIYYIHIKKNGDGEKGGISTYIRKRSWEKEVRGVCGRSVMSRSRDSSAGAVHSDFIWGDVGVACGC